MYEKGEVVWLTNHSCYGTIVKVRRSIGEYDMYDVEHDDGQVEQYLREEDLYPAFDITHEALEQWRETINDSESTTGRTG